MRSSISFLSPNSDSSWFAASSSPHLKLRSTVSTSRSEYPCARAARRILSAASSASKCSSLVITYSCASGLATCPSSASIRNCMASPLLLRGCRRDRRHGRHRHGRQHRLDGGQAAHDLLHQVVAHVAVQRRLFRFLGQYLRFVEGNRTHQADGGRCQKLVAALFQDGKINQLTSLLLWSRAILFSDKMVLLRF